MIYPASVNVLCRKGEKGGEDQQRLCNPIDDDDDDDVTTSLTFLIRHPLRYISTQLRFSFDEAKMKESMAWMMRRRWEGENGNKGGKKLSDRPRIDSIHSNFLISE